MNMKKAFAGVLASVVAISAMATTMVSAKNELTFTKDQAAFSKSWDLTATKFPVTWTGTAQSVYNAGTPGTITIGETGVYAIKIKGTDVPVNFTVANVTAAVGAPTANYASATSTLTITADNTVTTVAQLAAAIDAVPGFDVEVTYGVAVLPTTTVTVANVTGEGVATGYVLGSMINPNGAPSKLTVSFYKADTKVAGNKVADNLIKVDTAKLKVTGYVLDKDGKATLTSKEYEMLSNDDKNVWSLEQVTGTTVTSTGKIDTTYFKGGITGFDLSYTVTDDSKQKKSDADDLAKKMYKAYADIAQTGADNAFTAIFNSFDYDSNANVTSIDSLTGKVASSEVVHGVTFQGLNAGAYKNSAGRYQSAVTKQDTIYYFGTAANGGADARRDGLVIAGNVNSFKEETISTKEFTTEDNAKLSAKQGGVQAFDGTTPNGFERIAPVDVKWQNMIKEIQTLVGDAKGATLTFGVYSATSTDSGRGNDKFSDDTNAPIVSGATAQDFSFAINTASSAKFYSAANMKDNKITLSWDEITAGLAAGTGLDAAVRIAAGKKFVIDSVSIDVPAKTLNDLSAGEAAEETTVALETTAAPAADTTAAAANPTTGNAPIALAVIPVAIIAAAVVAKKRG